MSLSRTSSCAPDTTRAAETLARYADVCPKSVRRPGLSVYLPIGSFTHLRSYEKTTSSMSIVLVGHSKVSQPTASLEFSTGK